MMRLAVAVVVMALGGTAGSARAQGAGAEPVEYEFEDELVQSEHDRPRVEILVVRQGAASRSLIRVREHFVGEMLEAVEDL